MLSFWLAILDIIATAKVPGAQSERRDDARPVSATFRGVGSPAAFLCLRFGFSCRCIVDAPQSHFSSVDEFAGGAVRFVSSVPAERSSVRPNRLADSVQKRLTSSSSESFLCILNTPGW